MAFQHAYPAAQAPISMTAHAVAGIRETRRLSPWSARLSRSPGWLSPRRTPLPETLTDFALSTEMTATGWITDRNPHTYVVIIAPE